MEGVDGLAVFAQQALGRDAEDLGDE